MRTRRSGAKASMPQPLSALQVALSRYDVRPVVPSSTSISSPLANFLPKRWQIGAADQDAYLVVLGGGVPDVKPPSARVQGNCTVEATRDLRLRTQRGVAPAQSHGPLVTLHNRPPAHGWR